MEKNCFKVKGEELLKKVKEVVKEGNVRRIIIKNEKGEPFMEFPVNLGVVGVVFAPALVAIGAVAAMASSFSIEVVRKEGESKPKSAKRK